MRKATAAATKDPYLVLTKGLAKGVYAQSPDMAWEKYRDQLAQLHATTDREDVRQRMAWGAYQDLLRQNHEDMYRSFAKGGEGARGGHILGHTKSGKPVYAHTEARYAGIAGNPLSARTKAGQRGSGNAETAMQIKQAWAAEPGFTEDDHNDAAALHKKHAKQFPARTPERNHALKVVQVHNSGAMAAKYPEAIMRHYGLKKSQKPLGAAFSHGRAVAKRKGKAGDKKTAHAAAQRYLTANGHGKMGEDT